MKRSDITDREALMACWGYGNPDGRGGALHLLILNGYPAKVAERKLEHLVDRGLIEYGTSVAYPWRTPEGETWLDRPPQDAA